MFHRAGTQSSEEDYAERDKIIIIWPNCIFLRGRIVVREREKFGRVRARFRYEHMSKEDQSDEVEREA